MSLDRQNRAKPLGDDSAETQPEDDAEFSDRPSYLPDTIEYSQIPQSLRTETAFWNTGEGQKLSEEATQALMEAEALLTGLAQSDIYQVMHLDMGAKGARSVQGHCTRVAVRSLLINDKLRLRRSRLNADYKTLATASILHDYGKMRPDVNKVVMSDRRYTKDSPEWEIIKRHPKIGYDLVLRMPGFEFSSDRMRVAEAVYQHHERQNGSGYFGISSPNISAEAAVIAVADTMDAMSEQRTYKLPCANQGVMMELEKCKIQYHAEVLGIVAGMRHASGQFKRFRPSEL